MSAWPDDLKTFSQAIRGLSDMSDGIAVSPNYPVAAALEIYRNNYRGNLQGALAAAYPVIEQLVGKDFFRQMARIFIDQYPSSSGNLHQYGEELGYFLAGFGPAQQLPYLADVAKLEWACHRAYFSPDVDELDLRRLGQIEPEQYSLLRLVVHPACQILRLSFPASVIWHAHQPGRPEDFHIDLGVDKEIVLVSRLNTAVQVNPLSESDADWLEQILAGASLGEAILTILARHPEFDLQAILPNLIARGILIDFEL